MISLESVAFWQKNHRSFEILNAKKIEIFWDGHPKNYLKLFYLFLQKCLLNNSKYFDFLEMKYYLSWIWLTSQASHSASSCDSFTPMSTSCSLISELSVMIKEMYTICTFNYIPHRKGSESYSDLPLRFFIHTFFLE